jgi:hypothetical protein
MPTLKVVIALVPDPPPPPPVAAPVLKVPRAKIGIGVTFTMTLQLIVAFGSKGEIGVQVKTVLPLFHVLFTE